MPGDAVLLSIGWYGLHGWLRKLGHGGNAVGAPAPGMTGSTRLDGCVLENAIATSAVPAGTVSPNDHTGCAPFGAAIVTRMLDPARYTCPW